MKNRQWTLWIVLGLTLIAVHSVAADASSIVYENPWNSAAIDAGAFSQVGPDLGMYYSELAGEFVLDVAANVNRATWYGTIWSQPDPLDTGDTWNFDVRFFAGSPTELPGETLATHAVVATVDDSGVNIQGERAYRFDASFPSVALAADTPCWFSVINTGPPSTFRWNSATSGLGSAAVRGDGSAWEDYDELEVNVIRTPLNFTLYVPEPPTFLLTCLALLSLIARRSI